MAGNVGTKDSSMRHVRTLTSLIGFIALAASAPGGGETRAEVDACATRSDLLGVSRIVEIDTELAPKFGTQYADASFLEDGEIVLTFDDGPLRPYTRRVLDALDEQCTKATFFVVGRMAIADPELLKETRRRGHTIGLHTYAHSKLSTISAARAKEDIELGLSATATALGENPAPFFRFPYLRDTNAIVTYVGERKMAVFGINVDSRDFSTRNPAEVQKTVLNQLGVHRKGIILMHDIQTSTAGAIRSLLAELKKRGYRVVHVQPKTTATTIADYDLKASGLLAGKKVAADKSPLANRSIVWPAAKTNVNGAADPVPPGYEEVLPWLQESPAGPIEEPAPVRAPRRPEPPGLGTNPWQIH